MRVYLAGAMTNPARDLAVLRALLDHLETSGHEVPTRHVADPHGKAKDSALSDCELAARDLEWIATSDALVAEVSTPSHGVGIEVMAALGHGLPVLLLRRLGVPVSRLLLGLPGVESVEYSSVPAACAAIDEHLARAAARVTAGQR